MLYRTRTDKMKPPRKIPKTEPGDVKGSKNRFEALGDDENDGDDNASIVVSEDDMFSMIDTPREAARKRAAPKAKANPKGKGKGKGKAVSLIAIRCIGTS